MKEQFFPLTGKEAKASGIDYPSEGNKASRFATILRDSREKITKADGKKMSQAEAAKAIGVTKSSLSLYENGDNVPDARTIRKMAEVYGVSADYLLGLSEEPTNSKDVQAICEYTGLTARTISALHDMKDDTGFVRYFFEAMITRPVGYNGPFIYPLEEAREYVFRSAIASHNIVEDTADIALGKRDDTDYFGGLFFDTDSGRYTLANDVAADMLLHEACKCIGSANYEVLLGIREYMEHQMSNNVFREKLNPSFVLPPLQATEHVWEFDPIAECVLSREGERENAE